MAIPHWRTKDIGYTGISYPFRLDSGGRVATSTVDVEKGDLSHIKEALEQLIRTPVGSRFFNRDFGAAPVDIVFRLNTPEEINLALVELDELLRSWEPRVVLNHYEIVGHDPDQGWVQIRIHFTLHTGQTPDFVEVRYP